jgi:hypothetical protein
MMRFKPEVRIRDFTPQLAALFTAVTRWSLSAAVDTEINAVDENVGLHMIGTLHGWSLAADVDTVGDVPAETQALAEYLRRVLPPEWDVVFEGDHVHAEWDVHRSPLRRIA